jgi:hypothetical protein
MAFMLSASSFSHWQRSGNALAKNVSGVTHQQGTFKPDQPTCVPQNASLRVMGLLKFLSAIEADRYFTTTVNV